ncbi:MAG: DUF4105 domain-containing protein [Verrucomicrobiota bacterium]
MKPALILSFRILLSVLILFAGTWALTGIQSWTRWNGWLTVGLPLLVLIVIGVRKPILAGLGTGLLVIGFSAFLFKRVPQQQREWWEDQSRPPEVRFDGEVVEIRHFRNFTYQSSQPGDWTPNFETRQFDLSKLSRLDFCLASFPESSIAAHTFLSFGFGPDGYLCVSAEVRKERGEAYSVIDGIFRHYELFFTLGDERDLIGLRSHHRGEPVRIYPIRASPEAMKRLLRSLLERTGNLARQPEFYHTVLNNCVTTLLVEVNEATDRPIGYDHRLLFPAFSDELIFDLGLIDTSLSFDEARERFLVDPKAAGETGSGDYSRRLRAGSSD